MPKLTIHGDSVLVSSLPPKLQEIKNFLDGLPVHRAYTSRELGKEVGVGCEYLRCRGIMLGDKYRFTKGGNRCFYANPKTIQNQKEGMYDE